MTNTYTFKLTEGVHRITNPAGREVASAVLDFHADHYSVNVYDPNGRVIACGMIRELYEIQDMVEYYG